MISSKINIHPDNSMLYITNKGPDRLSDPDFADLRLYLKKQFPNHELKYFHDQPIWTYGASEIELRAAINEFMETKWKHNKN
jgi:hypothetical protein